MTWSLVRHHPVMKATYVKWLMFMWISVSLWLGIMALRLSQGEMSAQWISVTWIWIAPALYLVLGPHTRRARELPLTLPIPTRSIWNAHVIAVMLTSGLMFAVAIGAVDLVFRGLLTSTDAAENGKIGLMAALMPHFWLHGLAWWLLLTAVVLGDQPGIVEARRGRLWVGRQVAYCLLAYAGLSVLGGGSPWIAIVPLLLALSLFWWNLRRIPSAWSLMPRQPLPASTKTIRPVAAGGESGWRRRPLWLTVLVATSKHPSLFGMAAFFMAVIGLALSGLATIDEGGEALAVFLIPITAYSIFAMAGAPLMKVSIFDHLPISRHHLLLILLIPQLCCIGVGYLAGEVLSSRATFTNEPITWGSEPDRQGLLMSPRFFLLTWGDVPTITGPDGTTTTPPADWKPLGTYGPTLYKPFHTPEGASLDFCAWQLERASQHIFGQAIPAEEFKTRYLTETLEQKVILQGESLSLLADHPELKPRRFRGTTPLQILFIGVLFQIAYAIYLGVLRPGFSDKVKKFTFAACLVILMAIYMAPFILGILKVADPSGSNIMILALGEQLIDTMPGGLFGLYVLVILVLAVGHRLVLQQFRRAEWSPVREDDFLADVLG